MKLELICDISRIGSAHTQFFFNGTEILLQATYLESDIPKSQIHMTLGTQDILRVYGVLEAILSHNLAKDIIAFPEQDIGIILTENDRKSTEENRVLDMRIEKFSQSKFIQMSGPASKFCQLKFYLSCVLTRLI